MLGVSYPTILNMCKDGRIPHVLLGSRRRISLAAVRNLRDGKELHVGAPSSESEPEPTAEDTAEDKPKPAPSIIPNSENDIKTLKHDIEALIMEYNRVHGGIIKGYVIYI